MAQSAIGIIGLGAMGSAFAERLLDLGISPVVYNRTASAAAPLEALGCVVASTPGDVARRAETVVTILSDGAAVRAVLTGADGVFAAARRGSLIIDCSTIDPAVSRDLAAAAATQGLRFSDAGVGGLPLDARAGRLSVMYGAADADREAVESAMRPFAAQFAFCGGPGNGVTMKLISNLLSNAIHVANLEALVISERAGLDVATALRVLTSTAADNRQLHQRIPQELVDQEHQPGFMIDLAYKDISLGRLLAAQHEVPATVLSAARDLLATARERGRGAQSVTALLPTIRELRIQDRDAQ